jgi:hypothetical protein
MIGNGVLGMFEWFLDGFGGAPPLVSPSRRVSEYHCRTDIAMHGLIWMVSSWYLGQGTSCFCSPGDSWTSRPGLQGMSQPRKGVPFTGVVSPKLQSLRDDTTPVKGTPFRGCDIPCKPGLEVHESPGEQKQLVPCPRYQDETIQIKPCIAMSVRQWYSLTRLDGDTSGGAPPKPSKNHLNIPKTPFPIILTLFTTFQFFHFFSPLTPHPYSHTPSKPPYTPLYNPTQPPNLPKTFQKSLKHT